MIKVTGTYTDKDADYEYVMRVFRYKEQWFARVGKPVKINDWDLLIMLGQGTWFALYRKKEGE